MNDGPPTSLDRHGVLDVFCIAAGAIIGSGLFILPFVVFRRSAAATMLDAFREGRI